MDYAKAAHSLYLAKGCLHLPSIFCLSKLDIDWPAAARMPFSLLTAAARTYLIGRSRRVRKKSQNMCVHVRATPCNFKVLYNLGSVSKYRPLLGLKMPRPNSDPTHPPATRSTPSVAQSERTSGTCSLSKNT
ncbi:unnamed protein product, partial [Ectocarpus sp. 8 AP-2014]